MKQTRNTEEIITEMNLLFIKMDLLIKMLHQFKNSTKRSQPCQLAIIAPSQQIVHIETASSVTITSTSSIVAANASKLTIT